MPVTTGELSGRVTSIAITALLFVVVAFTEEMVIVELSPTGMRSAGSGNQVPVSSDSNFSGVPLKTLRSNRLPGTPYLGAIPHELYCHIVQLAEHCAVVHECT